MRPIRCAPNWRRAGWPYGTMAFEFFSPACRPYCRRRGRVRALRHRAQRRRHRGRQGADGRGRGLDIVPLVGCRAATTTCRAGARRGRDGHHGADGRDRASRPAQIASWCRYPPEGCAASPSAMPHDDYSGGDVAAKMREANERTLWSSHWSRRPRHRQCRGDHGGRRGSIRLARPFRSDDSMGIPGQFEHPVSCRGGPAAGGCRTNGKAAGVWPARSEAAEAWRARGFRAIAPANTDIGLLQEALRGALGRLRGRAGMSDHRGGCHCGNLRLEMRLTQPPERVRLRACGCSFCRAHQTRTCSDPNGSWK